MNQQFLLRCHRAALRDARGRIMALPDVESEGPRVGLIGDWKPLFELLRQELTLWEGEVTVAAQSSSQALASTKVGLASSAPTWPRKWTVKDYLMASARLAGQSPRAASEACERALESLALTRLLQPKLTTLTLPESRAVQLAAAILLRPEVLVVENPFESLDLAGAYWIFEAIGRASQGRQLIVSLEAQPTLAPVHSLLHGMDQLVVRHERGQAVRNGREQGLCSRKYRVLLADADAEPPPGMSALGWSFQPEILSQDLTRQPENPKRAVRAWLAEMPASGTVREHLDSLFAYAAEHCVTVLELSPHR